MLTLYLYYYLRPYLLLSLESMYKVTTDWSTNNCTVRHNIVNYRWTATDWRALTRIAIFYRTGWRNESVYIQSKTLAGDRILQ